MSKVVFLDIDGVVCTLRSHYAFGNKGGLMEAWDITSCQLIRRLCEKHNYEIVISSTWRNKPENVRLYLATYGLIDHLYGEAFPDVVDGSRKFEWVTPHKRNIPFPDGCDRLLRGHEIQHWLDNHKDVAEFIIIDDDSDMLENQLPRFIHTDGMDGFGSKDYQKFEELAKG